MSLFYRYRFPLWAGLLLSLAGCSHHPKAPMRGSVPIVAPLTATRTPFLATPVDPSLIQEKSKLHQLIRQSQKIAVQARSEAQKWAAADTSTVSGTPATAYSRNANSPAGAPGILAPGLAEPMPLPRGLHRSPQDPSSLTAASESG